MSDKADCILKNLIPLIMFFQLECIRQLAQASNLWATLLFDFYVLLVEQVLGVTSKEMIPKGTRFGPLVGESYTDETLPKDADRKYFWRVSMLHVSLWICVLAFEIHLCVFSKPFTSHPVSPSGDAAMAVAWHKLAFVVNAWHPVKVWLCLPNGGVSLNAATSDGFKSACTACQFSAWQSEVTHTAVWFQWRSASPLSPLLSAVVSLPVNTTYHVRTSPVSQTLTLTKQGSGFEPENGYVTNQ